MQAAQSNLPSYLPGSESQLPVDGATFIGRERELGAIREQLEGGARLLTLIGAPGMGKTRLALRYAEQQPRVLFVDLSSAETLADVCGAVGQKLGVLFSHDDELIEPIGRALAARGAGLCVLDNFEQVIGPAAQALERWLAAAPGLQLLVTSRQHLRLSHERLFELEPLSLPAASAPGAAPSLEDLAQSEALQLLLERAPRLELNPQNAALLADLARDLEGIPLVIELAAARLGVLDPAQLTARLSQRLDLLSRAQPGDNLAHASTRRQATLRGALAWSWEALSADERQALAAASVFRGGFSLEAFEQVAAPVRGAPEGGPAQALDILQSLCEKSLIRTVTTSDRQLSTRFQLFESVRAFAADQLRDGGETVRRHAQFFARACGEHLADLDGEPLGGAPWAGASAHQDWAALEWLAGELDNILLAGETLITSRSSADISDRLFLALGAGAVLSRRGPPARYLSLIEAAIHHASYVAAPAPLVARAELERARMLQRLGRMQEARECLRAALQKIAPLGAPRLTADLLSELGASQQASGELEAADASYARALHCLTAAESDQTTRGAKARALAGLGLLRHSQGRLEEAAQHYNDALALSAQCGARALEANLCKDLGSLRLQQRRFEEAREHYQRALALHRTQSAEALSDGTLVGIIEGNLGILEQEHGRLPAAQAHFERALRAVRRAGSILLEGHLLGYFGALQHEVALEQRAAPARSGASTHATAVPSIDSARECYRQSLLLLRGIGDRRQEGVFGAALGSLEAQANRLEASRDAFRAASDMLKSVGDAGLLMAVELHLGQLDLAEARAIATTHPERSAELRGQAEERLASAQTSACAQALSQSDDARFALRLLQLSLNQDALVYSTSDQRLSLAASGSIELGARVPLKRILEALIETRVAKPNHPLEPDELIAAGWPGERMTPLAAQNRLKVALSTLRKLGLREVLQRRESGYLLDPSVPARIEA